MAITKHVKHIRSSVADSIPTAEQLDYGEIAINYSAENERLFIKNANNEIVPFYSGKVIEENEQVTAAALTDLDSRINDTENMESITYSELKSKRDGGELVPGKHYRITDYVTTTSQENTQSAGHQFDVVVLALDEKTLSENAHAMLHEGDTYFSTNNADLSAWELKYCLDNDTNRFAWADDTNGKGVIYYMKDEWNNECPYDFKNIQFKRKLSNGALDTTNGDDTFVYTFNLWRVKAKEIEDASIIGNTLKNYEGHINGVYGNKINPVSEWSVHSEQTDFEVTQYLLNDIVFLNSDDEYGYFDGCYANILGYDCHSNTFGNGCYANILGYDCYSNTFGNYVNRNTFGNICYSNTFGYSCDSNTFGDYCSLNSFGNSCSSNTFGNYCSSNTVGNGCSSNTFGNDCSSNMFGNNAYGNTFGNGCYSNTFGNYCSLNSFGNAVKNVTFSKDNTYYVIVENGNQFITLTSTEDNQLRNITIAQGTNNANSESGRKTITHTTINDTFRTTYQRAGSVVVSV